MKLMISKEPKLDQSRSDQEWDILRQMNRYRLVLLCSRSYTVVGDVACSDHAQTRLIAVFDLYLTEQSRLCQNVPFSLSTIFNSLTSPKCLYICSYLPLDSI